MLRRRIRQALTTSGWMSFQSSRVYGRQLGDKVYALMDQLRQHQALHSMRCLLVTSQTDLKKTEGSGVDKWDALTREILVAEAKEDWILGEAEPGEEKRSLAYSGIELKIYSESS